MKLIALSVIIGGIKMDDQTKDHNRTVTKDYVKGMIDSIIDKCPSCRFKNITYSTSCDNCGFSWYKYFVQEWGFVN